MIKLLYLGVLFTYACSLGNTFLGFDVLMDELTSLILAVIETRSFHDFGVTSELSRYNSRKVIGTDAIKRVKSLYTQLMM